MLLNLKKHWKLVFPLMISFAALSIHFLPVKTRVSDPGFIFNIREVLGKAFNDNDIEKYTSILGAFVKKSEGGHYPDIKGELRSYDFKNGRIETINEMIFAVWYLFESSFARINGFSPSKPPVTGKDTLLKSFGFPAENKNFNSSERAFIWENEFDIRQVQLYREPAGGNNIVSIQAFLVIPWEGLGNFHQRLKKKEQKLPHGNI